MEKLGQLKRQIFSQISEEANIIGTHKENKDKYKHSQPAELDSEDVAVGNDDKSERGSLRGKGKEKVEHEHSNGVGEETNILKSLFDANGIHVSFFCVFVFHLYPPIYHASLLVFD